MLAIAAPAAPTPTLPRKRGRESNPGRAAGRAASFCASSACGEGSSRGRAAGCAASFCSLLRLRGRVGVGARKARKPGGPVATEAIALQPVRSAVPSKPQLLVQAAAARRALIAAARQCRANGRSSSGPPQHGGRSFVTRPCSLIAPSVRPAAAQRALARARTCSLMAPSFRPAAARRALIAARGSAAQAAAIRPARCSAAGARSHARQCRAQYVPTRSGPPKHGGRS